MYDKIIIGAGLYGLYAANYCAKLGQQVLVIEYDPEAFSRATYINQARVHMGYHYPRSYSTAIKSANYFDRFNEDYGFCINADFEKIYATSSNFSWTDSTQFLKFCQDSNIKCNVVPDIYFNDGMCDGVFKTKEYTYDAYMLRDWLLKQIQDHSDKIEIQYNSRIDKIEQVGGHYIVNYHNSNSGKELNAETKFLLNTTYASVNQILNLLGFDKFNIKYELCEIILCEVSDNLKNVGITVMDGPFFSIMPFGKTGYHSLTSVTFTPHKACKEQLPRFDCMYRSNGYCTPYQLGNCNDCTQKPLSAWPYMSSIAHKYMKPEYEFKYIRSLFSVKPILLASEIDDSRPTVIKQFSDNPSFYSVLSGKINTVYDLNDILQ